MTAAAPFAPLQDLLRPVPDAPPAPPVHLGPATVVEADPHAPRVLLGDGRCVVAQAALATLYVPTAGDQVLVLGQEARWYVVGVLCGHAPATIAVQGDLAVRAVGGRLSLVGDEGVEVRSGKKLSLAADTLETFAGTLLEKVGSASRWVRDQLHLRAGSSTRVIDGTDLTRARNALLLGEESVKVDAHAVHLGH
jgi:hypothetical protein